MWGKLRAGGSTQEVVWKEDQKQCNGGRRTSSGEVMRAVPGRGAGSILKDGIHPFLHSFIQYKNIYFVPKYVPISVLKPGIQQITKQSKTTQNTDALMKLTF